MLLNLPKMLVPELYGILYGMGHGDDIVIADANFPAAANAKRLCLMPGLSATESLELILSFIPIDTYVAHPIAYMAVAEGDSYAPDIWGDFGRIMKDKAGSAPNARFLSRAEFYAAARDSYAIVHTGEQRLYGNIIVKKGVISG
ncbi:MAG: fucose isomerase [Clostridiales bacterium]|jgi:L-fucose mutarotase|nr:fucose isomerase [Clostridiales bacterium]